jgi:hypothetical protein
MNNALRKSLFILSLSTFLINSGCGGSSGNGGNPNQLSSLSISPQQLSLLYDYTGGFYQTGQLAVTGTTNSGAQITPTDVMWTSTEPCIPAPPAGAVGNIVCNFTCPFQPPMTATMTATAPVLPGSAQTVMATARVTCTGQ